MLRLTSLCELGWRDSTPRWYHSQATALDDIKRRDAEKNCFWFPASQNCGCKGSSCPKPLGTKCPTQAVVSYLGDGAGMNSCLYLLITCLCQSYFLPETRKQSQMPPIHDNLVKNDRGVGSSFSFFGQPSAPGLIEQWPHWYPTSLFHIGEISLCAWFVGSW